MENCAGVCWVDADTPLKPPGDGCLTVIPWDAHALWSRQSRGSAQMWVREVWWYS